MKYFEVGKYYEPYQSEFPGIKIIKRTNKTILADNGLLEFRMKIRKDNNGDEFAIDMSVPECWRDAFTYFS